MFEAVTLVKVRKAQKIEVPAGGWIVIGTPETPLHEQIKARAKLITHENTNDDFERLLIGRIQDSQRPLRFITTAQAEDAKRAHVETLKSFEKSHLDAKARQESLENENVDRAQKNHEERVARLNDEHEAIRTREGAETIRGLVSGVTTPPAKTDAEELAGKTEVELRKVVTDLNADPKRKTKITIDEKATKEQVVAAILEATKVDGEKQPGFIARLFGAK